MKFPLAILAASALLLVAAPASFADQREPSGDDGSERVDSAYPPLPPECQPTADRTAIECTYDYGDRVDVQPAYGCWSLDDGSDICVDPPEIPDFVGCDYGAGECDIVVDPAADRCVVAYGPEIDRTIYLIRDGSLYLIEWNWGADPAADEALRQSWSELFELIATGNYVEYFARCAPGTEYTPPEDWSVYLPPEDGENATPLPDGIEGEILRDVVSSPVAAGEPKAEKGKKAGKAKKKSRGKKSKQKKSRR